MGSPARGLRFDAASNVWLTPIVMAVDDSSVQQVAADGEGILVGPNMSGGLSRIREDGTRVSRYRDGVVDIVAGERTYRVSQANSGQSSNAMSSRGEILVSLSARNPRDGGAGQSYIPVIGNQVSLGRVSFAAATGQFLCLCCQVTDSR